MESISLILFRFFGLWFLASFSLMAGCGAAGPTALNISIRAEAEANRNTPVAVAALVVYDDAEHKRLVEMTAGQWFRDAGQVLRDNPDAERYDVLQWEVQPGRSIRELKVDLKGVAARGLVFADYLSEGVHRMSFDPSKRILVILGKDDYTVVDLEEE